MPTPPRSDALLRRTVAAYIKHGRKANVAARELKWDARTFRGRLADAAKRGMLLDEAPVMPGFVISQTTDVLDEKGNVTSRSIKQRPEPGEKFDVPTGHKVKGVSALLDPDGREIVKWVRTREDVAEQEAAMKATVQALADKLPRVKPVPMPKTGDADLLNQYTITDAHMGSLAWHEETRNEDYDLKIAEALLVNWFAAAIRIAPPAQIAVLAQLGDLLHHDSHLSVTPTHANVLDADSRFQKIVRAVIRVMRQVIAMLLAKHERVHIVMADANHDPASGAWLREMFSAFYDHEPRVTVDSSPGTYYAFEHGQTSLFYHHGHRRAPTKDLDTVFAGMFHDIFGRTKHRYAHTGHKHADQLRSTNLMKVEQHETLAAPDAFAANSGWLSGRSAKVITYSKKFGEVGRIIISPQMVAERSEAAA